jgi:hypothetical protein
VRIVRKKNQAARVQPFARGLGQTWPEKINPNCPANFVIADHLPVARITT